MIGPRGWGTLTDDEQEAWRQISASLRLPERFARPTRWAMERITRWLSR